MCFCWISHGCHNFCDFLLLLMSSPTSFEYLVAEWTSSYLLNISNELLHFLVDRGDRIYWESRLTAFVSLARKLPPFVFLLEAVFSEWLIFLILQKLIYFFDFLFNKKMWIYYFIYRASNVIHIGMETKTKTTSKKKKLTKLCNLNLNWNSYRLISFGI